MPGFGRGDDPPSGAVRLLSHMGRNQFPNPAVLKVAPRLDTIDNYGKFQLSDPYRNFVVQGVRCDMSAEEVIAFCEEVNR